jgi:predicted trehalose synthase
MRKRILTEQQDRLLAEERSLLADLQVMLARHDADHEDQKALERSVRQLDELFLLVVAGEFNSGKSAFINALLGSRLLEEGVTPTTTRIHTALAHSFGLGIFVDSFHSLLASEVARPVLSAPVLSSDSRPES